MTRADLDRGYMFLVDYGRGQIELSGRDIPTWALEWATDNAVTVVVEKDAPPGFLYLRHPPAGLTFTGTVE